MSLKPTLLLLVAFQLSPNTFAEAPFGPVAGGSPDEMAGQAYGSAGCGIGALLWGSAPGMNQALAVTTNLILFNQSFGLSFGSFGCLSDEETTGYAINFSNENRETLLADIARGEGETVATLGELLNCTPASALGPALQDKFAEVVPPVETKDGLGKKLVAFVRSDAAISALCPRRRT